MAENDNCETCAANSSVNATTKTLASVDVHSALLGVLMVIVLVGNLGLIAVILSTRRLRIITNIFVISLAVSDLFVGAVVIPINLFVPTTMFYGYTTCMYAACFTIVVALSSIANIFAVTVDRFIAISQPLHYSMRMTPLVACAILVATWLYAGVLGLLPVMGWRVATSTCHRGETYPQYYVVLIFITGCIAPAWGSAVLYGKIFSLARQHQLRISQGQELGGISLETIKGSTEENPGSAPAHVDGWNNASNRNILKTLAILMLYFQLSWIPVFVSMVTDVFASPRLIPSWLHSLFATLAFVNAALDPLIYGYRNRDIRAAFLDITKKIVDVLRCRSQAW